MTTSTEHQRRPSHGPMQPVQHGTPRSTTTERGLEQCRPQRNLGDGAVSVSIITRDWFGNQQTVTSSGWTLNTTMVRTTFSLDTSDARVNNVGNYVGDFVKFIATPPAGGSFTMTAQSNGTQGIGAYSHNNTPHRPGPIPHRKITHQDNSGSTSQQRMHTDERLSMSTRSSSMMKSHQRQPSLQMERTSTSTTPHTSGRTDESSWPTSPTPEESDLNTHSVIEQQPQPGLHHLILTHPSKRRRTNLRTSRSIAEIVDQVGNIGSNTNLPRRRRPGRTKHDLHTARWNNHHTEHNADHHQQR